MDDAVKVFGAVKSNVFWGRRSGSWDRSIPKGHPEAVGNIIRQNQWGCGPNIDGKSRPHPLWARRNRTYKRKK